MILHWYTFLNGLKKKLVNFSTLAFFIRGGRRERWGSFSWGDTSKPGGDPECYIFSQTQFSTTKTFWAKKIFGREK